MGRARRTICECLGGVRAQGELILGHKMQRFLLTNGAGGETMKRMGAVYLQTDSTSEKSQARESRSPLLQALLRYLKVHEGTLVSRKEDRDGSETNNR